MGLRFGALSGPRSLAEKVSANGVWGIGAALLLGVRVTVLDAYVGSANYKIENPSNWLGVRLSDMVLSADVW